MIAILAVPFVACAQIGMKLYEDRSRPGFNILKDGARVVRELSTHTKQWRSNAYKALSVQPQNGNTEEGYENQGANIDETK